ncbi:DinB family protein [Paenibacillus aestuarii]|uniref:DinB family protein n=1 Tax=Paenibacillus aestuarii TaxID=516965 RepID=A0ABW0KBN8_9BACL|nr:DinB family protein [Paenibacillus aestuarii]
MRIKQAKLLLQVDNLQAALAFYAVNLQWEKVFEDPSGQAVMLQAAPDYYVMLKASGGRLNLSSWLSKQAHCPKPGGLVYMRAASVADVQRDLQERGFGPLYDEDDAGAIRKLFVPATDGYTIVYWEELFQTDEETLAIYASGAEEFIDSLKEATGEDLDAAEAPGKWSIRQHVLHVIDLELVTIHKVKFALAEPGRLYQGNAFSQDDWCAGLDYANRPIDAELAMFRAMRQHIVGLCKHLPQALQRTVVTSTREESVARLLSMMSGHAAHHQRAIARIRVKARNR